MSSHLTASPAVHPSTAAVVPMGSQLLLGTSKDFHNMLVKYTEFILKDIAKEFKLDYSDLTDKYVVKCFRSPPARKQTA